MYRSRARSAPHSSRQTAHRLRQRRAASTKLSRRDAVPAAERANESVQTAVTESHGDLLLAELGAAQEFDRFTLQVLLEQFTKRGAFRAQPALERASFEAERARYRMDARVAEIRASVDAREHLLPEREHRHGCVVARCRA